MQFVVTEPDLTVSNLALNPTLSDPGQALSLSFKVSNIGSGDAPATTAACYRSPDESVDSTDTEIGTVNISALAAGKTADLSLQSTAPETGGTYWYACRVEPVAHEASTNNQWSAKVQLNVKQPDLTVSALTISPTSSAPGHALTLSFKVSNIGSGDAPMVTATCYRSTDEP